MVSILPATRQLKVCLRVDNNYWCWWHWLTHWHINTVMYWLLRLLYPPYTCTRGLPWFSRHYAASTAASADTTSLNITDTQTYLYCHVAISIDIIDNITDIIALSGWQYLLMPMSLLPMRRDIYITVSVVLLTPVTISLICRHRLTYITVSVVLLTPVTISLICRHRLTYIAVSVVLLVIYHRRANIGPTYIVMSVILLILVTISVAILQYIYIALSVVIINY